MNVSPAEYHTWAQGSINRLTGADLDGNGLSHERYPLYKAAVKKLQKAFLPRVSGVVDRPTQDLLIQNNHIHAEYMKWVRECLWVLTGDNNVRTGNGHDKYVQDAISRYQGGKKKANLTVDGWVGVQTEIVLALETGIMPPARYGKPPDFPKPKNLDQHIKTWLDHTEIDLLEGTLPAKLPFKLAHHVDDRKYFALFVKRLIHGGYNYDYLDWSTVKDYCDLRDATARPEQLQHVNAMRHLRYLVTTKVNPLADNAYPLFLWACFEVFEDVEHGLWRVAYEYGRHSLDVEKGRTKLLMDYTEGRVANPSSFLSIYPGWREWKGKPTWEAAK